MLKYIFKTFTKRQIMMIKLLLLSNSATVFGAYFKIMDNPNGELLLLIGIGLSIIGTLGIVSKWAKGGPI
ncbi:MAG: hypothetical protein HLUCCX10_08645 [Algoriphagus marincola HL-49]|uniref:Uncharacterized protein n=1 Tax=Algoriphagus marincola HL-49 TaxID=1305737 RepID=A0A0P7YAS6_9BACT|nr:MAG: hypothetical protein HLUCCX10_08645 [Algoriphagus marincola HL-49]